VKSNTKHPGGKKLQIRHKPLNTIARAAESQPVAIYDAGCVHGFVEGCVDGATIPMTGGGPTSPIFTGSGTACTCRGPTFPNISAFRASGGRANNRDQPLAGGCSVPSMHRSELKLIPIADSPVASSAILADAANVAARATRLCNPPLQSRVITPPSVRW
jgi:hypothetical protein